MKFQGIHFANKQFSIKWEIIEDQYRSFLFSIFDKLIFWSLFNFFTLQLYLWWVNQINFLPYVNKFYPQLITYQRMIQHIFQKMLCTIAKINLKLLIICFRLKLNYYFHVSFFYRLKVQRCVVANFSATCK